MSTALTQIGIAQKALMEAKTLDDVKDIRDKAEAIRVYTKQRDGSLEAQNDAAELKVRAERKLGEMLRETERHEGGRPKATHDTVSQVSPTLSDMGVTGKQSSRWQKVADVPEEKLEEHIASMRESRGEITTNGVLRLAGELKRDVYLDRRDKVIDPLTEKQAAMLRGYNAFRIENKRLMEEADDTKRRRRRAKRLKRLFAKP